MIFKKKNFKNRYIIYYVFIEVFEFCEIKILIDKIKSRNFDINVKKDFSYVKLKIRKKDDYFHELFYYHRYRTTNYTFFFVFESNKFTIYTSFSIRFAI